jgi:predicted O-linked N-acetylglucosamine transferase (SPINDLY family)
MDRDTVAAWMVVMTQAAGARLWLLVSEPAARTHLRLLAAASGVHDDRLLLTPPLPKQVHLSTSRPVELSGEREALPHLLLHTLRPLFTHLY